MEEPDPAYGNVNIHPLDENLLIVETRHDIRDGTHSSVSLVDLRSKRWIVLHEGELLGVSPDRRWVAVAPHDWVGPYKCGGERVGAVFLVSLDGGRTRRLTSPLIYTAGRDWR